MNHYIQKIIDDYVKFNRVYHEEYNRQTFCVASAIDAIGGNREDITFRLKMNKDRASYRYGEWMWCF